jgi:hypothetical protein
MQPAPATVVSVQRALQLLQGAENALQRGDWEAHGREMQRLKQYLEAQAAGGGAPAGSSAPR